MTKTAKVSIITETGCSPDDGEFSVFLQSMDGDLDINSPGGVDDISLIIDAVNNDIDFSVLPEEGETNVVLAESGEWEGYQFHKYWSVVSVGDLIITSMDEIRKQAVNQELIALAMSEKYD